MTQGSAWKVQENLRIESRTPDIGDQTPNRTNAQTPKHLQSENGSGTSCSLLFSQYDQTRPVVDSAWRMILSKEDCSPSVLVTRWYRNCSTSGIAGIRMLLLRCGNAQASLQLTGNGDAFLVRRHRFRLRALLVDKIRQFWTSPDWTILNGQQSGFCISF